jgi:S-adenosylmethionine:tRNA ribosyltransferase-isomerase
LKRRVLETNEEGHRRLRFDGIGNILNAVEELGEVPSPAYIRRTAKAELAQDRERYQTVFAQPPGSVAAPTAGTAFHTRVAARDT